MDIREQLLLEHSKQNSILIRDYIGKDKDRFNRLIELFLSDEYRVSQRTAMVISACFDRDAELFQEYRTILIRNLLDNEVNIAVKRNTIRILQFMEIPEKLEAPLFDLCLRYLEDRSETIAVKAFSMRVAFNICKQYPELRKELKTMIELNMEENKKAGIKARGSQILKELDQL